MSTFGGGFKIDTSISITAFSGGSNSYVVPSAKFVVITNISLISNGSIQATFGGGTVQLIAGSWVGPGTTITCFANSGNAQLLAVQFTN